MDKSEMSNSAVELLLSTPTEPREAAKNTTDDLLPSKSKAIYESAYSTFADWKKKFNTKSTSETVLMAYFDELSKKYKPSSMWSIYSMLKSTINIKEKIDIGAYPLLTAFLKKQSAGFHSKKSNVLSSEEVQRFLTEAPDSEYLVTKVALIFGICGACRSIELVNIKVQDITKQGDLIIINLQNTRTNKPRSFVISQEFSEVVKKYEALRPSKTTSDRFFLNYQKGKCTTQVIGIHKFCNMPKEIARFLNLSNPETYTGHAFRRTSATLLAYSGANITTLKRHGGWKSSTIAEGYIEETIKNKANIGNLSSSSINMPQAESSKKSDCKSPPSKHIGVSNAEASSSKTEITKEVCLRWNTYYSNMQNSFPSLLDAEQFVDVTLACEGRSLKCHKMILSSCSDYLADLLRENPCQHPIILMKDLKFWEVEALVKFMYRGEVNVAQEKLPQLLIAAEALKIKGLTGCSQNTRPPLPIPQGQVKQAAPPVPTQVASEAKENHPSTSSSLATVSSSPKRAQKRHTSEAAESRPFTKIRLQRPSSPVSPTATVKLEPLDVPVNPTEMFSDNNLMRLREEEDPGGRMRDSEDQNLPFGNMDGPPDLPDGEDQNQVEFVTTDFLKQEQDIFEDLEPDASIGEREESRKSYSSEDCEDDEIDEKEKKNSDRST